MFSKKFLCNHFFSTIIRIKLIAELISDNKKENIQNRTVKRKIGTLI